MANILIIEDNPVHNVLLCHCIEDLNHTPIPSSDVDEAKEYMEQKTPDLIIIDMELNGSREASYGLIMELLESKKLKHIPIIIVSAYVKEEDIKKKLPSFPVENLIEKPFNSDTISLKVKDLLKRKK
jgi:CheY-like chemotaxis protein